MRKFEWAVVGSGIAGVVAAEILTRERHSTILIEKNEKLASETSRDFHEWMHTGSLYTLIPDNLMTLKFMLGAVDDLLEYYSSFHNMNITPTEHGLIINQKTKGWFENNHIHFKFRVKDRKWTFPWILGAARAIFLIGKIEKHDWLRRRAGVIDPFKLNKRELLPIIEKIFKHREKFYDCKTTDFTINSRNLLNDLIYQSVSNGLEISNSNAFVNWERKDGKIIVNCLKENFEVERLVLCISSNIAKHVDSNVKISYAPLAVVKNIHPDTNSFVELDYYPKNCINMITKSDGIGLVGGISFSDINKCHAYIEQVIEKQKEYNPELKVLHTYNGIKSEITFKDQPRNYLYHILNVGQNIWGIIPGKFALGFSIAPEFYRQVYKRNPRKYFEPSSGNKFNSELISNTVWYDAYNQNK